MSDIILDPEYEALKNEIDKLHKDFTALIMEKDELVYHICPNIESEYMLSVGMLEYKIYEFQCKIFRIKRKIELIQQKFNRQEIVIIKLIEAQLDREYAKYEAKLKEKLEILNEAMAYSQGEPLSMKDKNEIKRIYRKIVKKLHPDMNPEVSPEEQRLFLNAVRAYKSGDLKTLQSIEILIDEISSSNNRDDFSIEDMTKEKEKLKKNINSLIEYIGKIKKSFPYNQKQFLEDEKAVEEKKEELNRIIENHKEMYKHYEEKLSALLGG